MTIGQLGDHRFCAKKHRQYREVTTGDQQPAWKKKNKQNLLKFSWGNESFINHTYITRKNCINAKRKFHGDLS